MSKTIRKVSSDGQRTRKEMFTRKQNRHTVKSNFLMALRKESK